MTKIIVHNKRTGVRTNYEAITPHLAFEKAVQEAKLKIAATGVNAAVHVLINSGGLMLKTHEILLER